MDTPLAARRLERIPINRKRLPHMALRPPPARSPPPLALPVHELSIAMHLITLAGEAAADDAAGARIDAVRIRIGELSGVVVEALEFAWDMARAGTACGEARLEIQRVPAPVHCSACNHETDLEPPLRFRCPRCNRPTADIVAGREMELVALKLIDPPQEPPASTTLDRRSATTPPDSSPAPETAHAAPHP